MKKQSDEEDFNEWVDNFFDLDPMILNIVYLLWQAHVSKQTTGIGLIVETEPRKPITDSEVANLSLHLMEKGLTFKHKGNKI